MNAPAGLGLDSASQHTLDHVSALVRVWTPGEGVVFVNRAWRDLTGTTLEDNAGDGWLRLVHDEDRTRVLMALGSSLDGGPTEYRLMGRDGTAMAVTDTPSTTFDETSRHLVSVLHTVTLQQTGARPEQVRTMSQWAHELRGPLNAILGWSDLLGTGDSEIEVVQRGLKAIANNARQQAAIIKRMAG